VIPGALPTAETVVLNDQGHLAMLAAPDHFGAAIAVVLAYETGLVERELTSEG